MAAARGISGDEVIYHGLYEGYTLTAVSKTKSVRILYVSTNSDAYPNHKAYSVLAICLLGLRRAPVSELLLHGRS